MQSAALLSVLGANVAGHEYQCVAEIQGAIAGGQRQATAVEYVEQAAHHLPAGFLQFIEEYDTGPAETAGDGVCIEQGSSFLAADVAGRRTGQRRSIVLLGQSVHVDTAESVRLAMNGQGQQPHDLGLADAGRAEKQIDRERPFSVADTGLDHPQHALQLSENSVLANDATAQQGHHVFGFEEKTRATRRGRDRFRSSYSLPPVVFDDFVDEWHGLSCHCDGAGLHSVQSREGSPRMEPGLIRRFVPARSGAARIPGNRRRRWSGE